MTEKIPPELKKRKQWVNCYKNSKVPMQSTVRKAASSDNPDTWSDFDTAVEAVNQGVYDNIGFVFNNSGIVGIDIDAGFDDGLPTPLTIDCMTHCQSYTEISRSGRGIHILVKGSLSFNGRNNRKGCEIYQTGRYFILTGKTLIYTDLIENQEAIDYIVNTYFPDAAPREDKKTGTGKAIYQPLWEEIKDGKIPLNPIYPPIEEGCRNISLTSLAGSMRCAGYNPDLITEELVKVNNEVCSPPLSDYELKSIIKSIQRYDK